MEILFLLSFTALGLLIVWGVYAEKLPPAEDSFFGLGAFFEPRNPGTLLFVGVAWTLTGIILLISFIGQ